jgi:hypothetical protein
VDVTSDRDGADCAAYVAFAEPSQVRFLDPKRLRRLLVDSFATYQMALEPTSEQASAPDFVTPAES